jgi:hypothetical protein
VHTFDKWCRMADRYARRVVMEPARRYIGTAAAAAAAEVSLSQRLSFQAQFQAQLALYCSEIRNLMFQRRCYICDICRRACINCFSKCSSCFCSSVESVYVCKHASMHWSTVAVVA